MAETSSPERDYLPGMGKHYLLPFYDLVHQVSALARVHAEMVELARPQPGQRVLDVGCGTGNLLRATAKRHRDVELSGVDPDLKMLARAERKLRRRARLDRGYAQELGFPGATFDVVFSSLMLHHLDTTSKDEMLAEVRRVLKPGGVLVLADIVHHHRGPMKEHLHDNVGDSVRKRIEAAGFTVEPTRVRRLRMFGTTGVEVARVH
ncbi:class I SAM-dependent methyltransferase [Lentzea sp. CA-135723]|uniref:class I SAM-dependent methyltransferase n=1 Tax=Lentzea sp. CA-135723 TaxID=3239950 RepID=UPI003D910FE3